MNKLFTKIATAFVGMAMAIGVGVAVANNREIRAAKADDPLVVNLNSSDLPNGWSKSSGVTYSNSQHVAETGGYFEVSAETLFGHGNVLASDFTALPTMGRYGTGWNSDDNSKNKADFTVSLLSSTETVISSNKVTESGLTKSNADKTSVTVAKPDDVSEIAKVRFIFDNFLNDASTSSGSIRVNKLTLTYSSESGTSEPIVSVDGTAGPFYTSSEEITLTANPSNITPTSYTWAITSGDSYVTPGVKNASTFTMAPVSAGTVEGTLTVSDGTDNASCNWAITIQAVAVTSVSWGSTSLYWLTNTSFNRTEFGTVTVTYNDGSQTTPAVTDSKMKVYAKVGNGEYEELSTKMFTTAGEYTCKVNYDGKDSGTKSIKVGNNTGTISYAKTLMANYGSGSSTINWTGTYTTTTGVINEAPTSSYGNLYLGDAYDGTSTDDSVYLYTCSSYGPVSGYSDLIKGGYLSVSGTLTYYKSKTPEITNYTVLSFNKYNGLSVKTAPTKVSYYVGDVFDPTGTVLTVTYSDTTTRDITSGYTYDLTSQLTTLGEQTVTFTFIENGISKTCTQTINVLPNPYTLTISQNALTMSEYSENTAITLTPSAGFGNDYVWEDVATTDSDVAVATIGENDLVTITSGEAGPATLTFEVYTSDLEHSASVALNVTVAAGSVVLSVNSVEVDVHGSSKTVDVTLANFESVPNITFSGNDSNYFTIAASNVTKTSATLTITGVAIKAATNVTINVKTPDEYQSGSATLSITVVDTALTVALSGTEVSGFSKGNVPTNWKASGNSAHATNYTKFGAQGSYFEHDLVLPETNGDTIYAIIAQVYSCASTGNDSYKNTITVNGLHNGEEIEGSTDTFETITATISGATEFNNAMTDANSKWAMVYGTGINGIKFTLSTRKANWIVGSLNLFYLTKAEYDLAVALGDAAMESICTAGQSRTTPSDDLSSLWETLKTNYSSLSTALGSYAYATTGTKATNHILDIALNRYNYICDKYNMDNFLQRTIVPTANHASIFNSIAESSNTVPVIIVVITLIGITAVGGYFFIRKRKHQ